MAGNSFFAELRKRKVVQAAAIYGAVAWGVTEVVVTYVDQLFLPQWLASLALIFFVVGFPVAMFLAWAFDITADGIRRTTVGSRRGTASIVASLVLLVAGTAGLFFLIKPNLQDRDTARPAALMVAANSVAVLPFSSAGISEDDAYLVEGLSDELRDQLARVRGMRVAARRSSIAALDQGVDTVDIAARLGVAHLVDANVRRQGNLLKVSVQLVDGVDGLTVWSEIFERSADELLSVQQAIAEAVVANVLSESEVAVAGPATRNSTANELMLLARHYETQVRERQEVNQALLLESIRLYREAAEADPESALAQSRLAGVLIYSGDLDAAEAPIFKALSINPNLSEVQDTLGEFHWARGLTGEARTAWARAAELDPNNPSALVNYALSRWYARETEGVGSLYLRALELDPLNLERYSTYGTFLAFTDQFDATRKLIGRIEALFDDASSFRIIAELCDYLGDIDQSIAWTLRALRLEPDNVLLVQRLAEYYADIGDEETAIRLDPDGIGILFKLRRYGEMIELAEFAMIDEPDDLLLRSILAIAYNATGRYESAIHVLSTTGLPDSVFNGVRSTVEMKGYTALMSALSGLGQMELARELADFRVDLGRPEGNNWSFTLEAACDFAVLGEYDEVRVQFRKAQLALHLAWDPVLKDAPCFAGFQDDPVYQSTVRHFDDLRALLRNRLPATLAEFGVSL